MPRINPASGGRAALVRGSLRAALLVKVSSAAGASGTALHLERIIKRTLSKPGSGRRYKRGKKWHTASAPGEPPAVDRGDLRRSIGREYVGQTWRVGTHEERSPALEFGHVFPNGRVLAPRPFFRPSARELERHHGPVIVEMRIAGRRVASGW